MPTAADLAAFLSASNQDTDAGTPQGGAIDLLRRPDFTQITANDTIQALSSAAGDTMNVTVEGRNAAGQIVTETKALTGTTAITFNTLATVERILKVELASAPVGSITIRRTTGPVTIRIIPIGERGFSMIFRKTVSDPSATKTYYQKIFWRNGHASQALTTAIVKQNADPDARITHLLAVSKGDSATSTNRVTAPAIADTQDPDTFDDTDKNVPTGDLGALESIGTWLRLQLPSADASHRTTYTSELTGQSV